MDRDLLIKERAKSLYDEFIKLNEIEDIWCEDCQKFVPNTSMEVDDFLEQATEDVDWFTPKIEAEGEETLEKVRTILSNYADTITFNDDTPDKKIYYVNGKSVNQFINEIKKVEIKKVIK